MRKIFSYVSGTIVFLGLLLFFVPNFVDLNDYKTEIATEAQKFVGRDVKIDGAISLSLLPNPTLTVENISIPNVYGTKIHEFFKLESIEAHIAFLPIFLGKIKISTLKLINPVVAIERLADGTGNWEIYKKKAPVSRKTERESASQLTKKKVTPRSSFKEDALAINKLVIEGGVVTYVDPTKKIYKKISDINFTVLANSIDGPFEGTGTLLADAMQIKLVANIGRISKNSSVPLKLELLTQNVDALIDGTMLNIETEPYFDGSAKINIPNLSTLMASSSSFKKIGLPKKLLIKGQAKVRASLKSIVGTELDISLGDQKISGALSINFGKNILSSLTLKARQLDLDRLLNQEHLAAKNLDIESSISRKNDLHRTLESRGLKEIESSFSIPKDLIAQLSFEFETIKYKGEAVREGIVNIEFNNKEITINQFSAQFPGATDLAVLGVLSLKKSQPTLEGDIEVQSSDFRLALGWFGIDTNRIPADRLRKVFIRSKFIMNRAEVKIINYDMSFDSSKITGAAVFALRKRPSFGMRIVLDQINLDAYLRKKASINRGTNKSKSSPGKLDSGAQKKSRHGKYDISFLGSFDANINLSAKKVIFHDQRIQNLSFDGMLHNGKLKIRGLSFENFAGFGIFGSGTVNNLSGNIMADDVYVVARAESLDDLYRYLNKKLPRELSRLRNISVKTKLNGLLQNLLVQSELSGSGFKVVLGGNLGLLNFPSLGDISVKLSHPSLTQMLRVLSLKYRPREEIGPIKLSGTLNLGPTNLVMSKIDGSLGPTDFLGDLEFVFNKSRPFVGAKIAFDDIVIDKFLPREKSAGFFGALQPASFSGNTLSADIPQWYTQVKKFGGWSNNKIDFSSMKQIDGDFTLSAKSISFQKYKIKNVDSQLSSNSGVIKVKRFVGQIFDGPFEVLGTINIPSGNTFTAKISVSGAQLADAGKVLDGKSSITGKISTRTSFSGNVQSEMSLISSITGNGQLIIEDIDVIGSHENRSVFSGFINLMGEINNLGVNILGPKHSEKSSRLITNFSVSNGKFYFPDIKIKTNLGHSQAQGTIDIPNWQVGIDGQIKLAQTLIGVILSKKGKKIRDIPFSIGGSLDNPKIKIRKAKLSIGGVSSKADRLLKKLPKGAEKLIDGVLGDIKNKLLQPPGDKKGPESQVTPKDLLEKLLKF